MFRQVSHPNFNPSMMHIMIFFWMLLSGQAKGPLHRWFRVHDLGRGRPSDESQAWLWHYRSLSDSDKCPRALLGPTIAIFAQQQHPQFVYHCASEEGPVFHTRSIVREDEDFPSPLANSGSSWGKRWKETLTALNSEPEGVLQYRKPRKKITAQNLWIQGVDLHTWTILFVQ